VRSPKPSAMRRHVLQTTFRIGHDVLTQDWSRMLFGQLGSSCHIDGRGFGHSALELHFTSDGGLCPSCYLSNWQDFPLLRSVRRRCR